MKKELTKAMIQKIPIRQPQAHCNYYIHIPNPCDEREEHYYILAKCKDCELLPNCFPCNACGEYHCKKQGFDYHDKQQTKIEGQETKWQKPTDKHS